MAGDWIKMRTDLYRDPKVCVIADELMARDGDLARYVSQMNQRDMTVTRNVTRNATVGALVTVWGVMRHRGKRVETALICRGVSLAIIDDVADLPGFGAAMASVHWVAETDEGLIFPGFFDEYNVDPSEKKAGAAAERQRRYREAKTGKRDVTRDVTGDVTVTHREEKRREEKKEQKKEKASPSGSRLPADWQPTETEQRWARDERPDLDVKREGERFRDYWVAVAGAKGRKADWPATWRNWVRNAHGSTGRVPSTVADQPGGGRPRANA